MSYSAAGQGGPTTPTPPPAVDDGEPYGGVSIHHGNAAPGAPPPANAGGVCNPGDPCVLTGQYSRYRTSANPYETTLAGLADASSFGLTNFYPFPSHTLPPRPTPPGGNYTFEPAVAQPLYITRLPVGGVNKNVPLAASLDDYPYAFDTSDGTPLWSANLANDCGSTGVPFDNNYSHSPGGTNLVYYGVVATPVIDIYSGTAPVPTAFVVSACVEPSSAGPMEPRRH
jgi:outer membrane protein assembly factor BamB